MKNIKLPFKNNADADLIDSVCDEHCCLFLFCMMPDFAIMDKPDFSRVSVVV